MMKGRIFTKILAIIGTALVWFPILAPVILTLALFITRRIFRFDYLMPAELFPSALIGGGLLTWAALRSRRYIKLVCWSLGIAIVMLIGGQSLAVVTGLASGATEPTGLPWVLVLGTLVVFTLALLFLAVGGVLMLRYLFSNHHE